MADLFGVLRQEHTEKQEQIIRNISYFRQRLNSVRLSFWYVCVCVWALNFCYSPLFFFVMVSFYKFFVVLFFFFWFLFLLFVRFIRQNGTKKKVQLQMVGVFAMSFLFLVWLLLLRRKKKHISTEVQSIFESRLTIARSQVAGKKKLHQIESVLSILFYC